MSRSTLDKPPVNTLLRTLTLLATLSITSLLSGCDGGLFGTGTGSDDNINASQPDLGQPVSVAPETDVESPEAQPDESPDSPSSIDGAPTDSPGEPPANLAPGGSASGMSPQATVIDFSNTTPSGIDPTNTTAPALKLINLGDVVVRLSRLDVASDAALDVLPQSTSELLGVNTGESTIVISTADGGTTLAGVDPLNAVQDSITTLVLSDTELNGESGVSLQALDTQVATTASAMSLVRLINIRSTGADTTQYTLSPDGDASNGVELVLSSTNEYALANTSRYILSSSAEGFAPMPITLASDAVYSIIVTGDSQNPVYLELDNIPEN